MSTHQTNEKCVPNVGRFRGASLWLITLYLIAASRIGAQDGLPTAGAENEEYASVFAAPIERMPYQLQFRVAFQEHPACSERLRSDVLRHLRSTVWATLSAQWETEVLAETDPRAQEAQWLNEIAVEDFERLSEQFDKVMFCSIARDVDRWVVRLRELDLVFLQLGPVFQGRCREAGQLARTMVDLAHQAFTPHAAVQQTQGRRVVIRLKASRLPLFDRRMRLVQAGSVFRPFRLRTDPDTGHESIEPVAWAYLVATEVSGSTATCQLVTAVRGAVPPPAQDPAEVQLLGVKSNGSPSTLTVVARDNGQPIVALEAEARSLAERYRRPLGTTNFDGQLTIPPSRNLLLIYLRQGRRFLAVLPVLPGSGPLPVAQVPTFEERLEIEGRVAALQEEVVDFVVERTVLINTLKVLMKKEQWEKAAKVVRQLKALPAKEVFDKRLQAIRELAQQLAGEGKPVPPSVQRLLDETQKLIERYVDPAVIKEAIGDYESLRPSS